MLPRWKSNSDKAAKATPDEASPLLSSETPVSDPSWSTNSTLHNVSASSGSSDASDSDSDSDSDDADIKERRAQRLEQTGSRWAYLKDFTIFLPFLVPRGDRKVQLCMVASALCIAGNRVLNILVPRQLGIAADQVLRGEAPYEALAVWLALSLLHDNVVLDTIDVLAMIPIKQFSYRRLAVAAFEHVMSLSMDFHSERDSAEVMKAVEQGEALTNILETALSEMAPTVVDLSIALVILYVRFSVWMALTMGTACVFFITLEVTTSRWNIHNRRRMTKAQRSEARVMHQAVQGWQTVSIFNMFGYERTRFGAAVDAHLAAQRDWSRRDAYIKGLLELFVPVTFFALSCLVFRDIARGRATAGDFVFLIQYWDNLMWPLKFLADNYRYIMSDMIDAERLLGLFQTRPTIADAEGARELGSVSGRVDFEHVCFSYNAKKASLTDINITALPGQTVALVGTTGAGKSSIMKLMMRFYDISSGSIKIDGHDIRDITLSSLRDALGLVPQDPVLFNDSILENVRYARPQASPAQVTLACQKAAIHTKITTFPDGYDTKVGEQGVKLSRGEVQRLAIARVFLRDPPVLILDEATSAVDTNTETEIQAALDEVSRMRTTFVIAHRLSTVMKADQILVLEEGEIIQRGTHQELLAQEGKYQRLCKQQLGLDDIS